MNKKYYILTIGCQMNKSDSERLSRVFESLGYSKTDEETKADIIAVNACSVRQAGINKIFSKIHNWNKQKVRQLQDGHKSLLTILTGCVLSEDQKKFEKLFDSVINIKKIPDLDQVISKITAQQKAKVESSEEGSYFNIKPIYQNPSSVFVPIMTGCNNFCSYCAVPMTRGREISRGVESVLDEIRQLSDNNCLEITLLGQNVNTYAPSDSNKFAKNNPYKDSFAALLWEINQLPNINRLHFTAPHPKDMSNEVIDALTLPKMVNFLHLPLQSGDDDVLKRMNRNYTGKNYLDLIKKIQTKKPNIALATDIIVGFPGESEEQFENTLKLYKEIEFDISYNAKYSSRPGTLASKYEDDIVLDLKKERWDKLQKLMEDIVLKKNQQYLGQTVEVLVDKKIDNLHEGNSREYKRVRFYSDQDVLGKIVKVKIDKAMIWMLEGKLI